VNVTVLSLSLAGRWCFLRFEGFCVCTLRIF